MSNIEIKPLWHKGKNQLGLYFKYDDRIMEKVKSIGAIFSYTHRCWYIENTEENKRCLLKTIENATQLQVLKKDAEELKNTTKRGFYPTTSRTNGTFGFAPTAHKPTHRQNQKSRF